MPHPSSPKVLTKVGITASQSDRWSAPAGEVAAACGAYSSSWRSAWTSRASSSCGNERRTIDPPEREPAAGVRIDLVPRDDVRVQVRLEVALRLVIELLRR
jgi:hypothetical protein